jgi:CHAT domain-containing protein/tetratricopeptide (TPR) repeat protein
LRDLDRLRQAESTAERLIREQAPAASLVETLEEVVELAARVEGEDAPRTGAWLNRLAGVYRQSGNPRAEEAYERCVGIARRLFGPLDPRVAVLLSNLGGVYRLLEKLDDAERCYKQALSIDLGAYGPGHPETLTDFNHLALVRLDRSDATRDDRDEGRAMLEMVRAAHLRHHGPDHPVVAEDHLNWASVLTEEGNWSGAEREARAALRIFESVYSGPHAHLAAALASLAGILGAQGAPYYEEALRLQERSLAMDERLLGPGHPDVAAALFGTAIAHARMGAAEKALPLMVRACEIDNRIIGQVFAISSESQRLRYVRQFQEASAILVALVVERLPDSAGAVRSAFDLVLRRKAIVLESLALQREAVLGGRYPALEPELRELSSLRARITQATLAGPGPEGLAAHQQVLVQWNARKERLEADLARQIPEMNLEQRLRAVDRRAVARALPEGAALVEFLRFDVLDFEAVRARGDRWWKPPRYAAFVLAAGEPEGVRLVDLGDAGRIDRLIAAFRSRVAREGESRGARDLGSPPPPDAGPAPDGAAAALRAAVFDPLARALQGRRRLFLAPDGDLTRLPLEALPLENGRCLIDEFRISYLGTGRDTLRLKGPPTRPPGPPVIAADPDFDTRGPEAPARPAATTGEGFWSRLLDCFRAGSEPDRPPVPAPTEAAPPGRRSQDLDRASLCFGRLPGTRVEGERVAAMLGVEPWVEGAALEARLRSCRSPRILHLATHGFFLRDQPHDRGRGSRDLGALAGIAAGLGRLAGPGMENPLLRSGLALAGANTFLRGGPLPPEAEDGLLTAEDVSGLDLLDTELVVLSACETGLGEVQVGEGVFGLRRAFMLAGARTLVMSLWKVPDLATAILMQRFYENLLQHRLRRDEALHQAQRYVRDVTVGEIRERWLSPEGIERLAAGTAQARTELEDLARQPDEHRPFQEPYYWGAFICQGDPAPLSG